MSARYLNTAVPADASNLIHGQPPGSTLMNKKAPAPHPTTELIRTHAERMALEAEERLQQRRLALAEQCSVANPPDVRVRAWERVHALRLPGDARHPVLAVIAHGTGLTLEQVRQEQRARMAQRTTQTRDREPGGQEGQVTSGEVTSGK
jgi:hypothetical protein